MHSKLLAVVIAVSLLAGCQSAYYGAMEKVGIHKRDILVDRIEDVHEAQVDVKEQFSSALERFTHELNFDGGDLEKTYKLISGEYEDSLARAEELSERIDNVDDVAEALFDEWEDELDEFSSARLKRESAAKLRDTRRRYAEMISVMRNTEKKMAPVLDNLRDNTLYLKHNLNARAIASLKDEFGTLKKDIHRLIKDVEVSISAAESFMATLRE